MILTISLTFGLQSGCQEAQKIETLPQAIAEEQKPVKQPEPVPEGPPPVIEVENSSHNFGEIGPDKYYNCSFKFKNTGQGILKIKRIQSTCGCTVPKLAKKEYAPNESGEIKVKFHSPKSESKVNKHLYIMSNDPENPKIELALKAQVILSVSVEPKKIKLLPDAESSDIPDITIKSKDGKEFSIKSITAPNNIITADFDPAVKATEFVLQLKADYSKIGKRRNGVITIGLTHPQNKEVAVSYSIPEKFEVSRPRIIIRDAKPGETITKEVWIKSNYGDQLEIESISSQKQHMKVISQESEENNSIKLIVEITIPEKTGKTRYFTDDLTVKTKDGTELFIRCSGWYKSVKVEKK